MKSREVRTEAKAGSRLAERRRNCARMKRALLGCIRVAWFVVVSDAAAMQTGRAGRSNEVDSGKTRQDSTKGTVSAVAEPREGRE